ncbi:MAG TPA: tetratricopeptide repeat protein [Verrucomicrobiae bacterium]|nr:tetratricopeptide repeat protein [Verrucomicrobiae bacterium]
MKEQWKSGSLGAVLIVLLTCLAYFPVLRGGFIWDDDLLITDNPMIKSDQGLYWSWFTERSPDYWPLTSTAWWLEWRVWGNHPLGYHLLNVLLHAMNAVLIWKVLKLLRIPGAWLAAMIFAVHPVNVATVAWISEQKNTLSMLFYLMALIAYLKFDESGGRRHTKQDWYWYGLSVTAFLLALLCKTAVIMLPVILLLCVWWRHDRIERRDVWYSAPFFLLSLVLGLVTVWFQHNQSVQLHLVPSRSPLSRLAAAGWMPWFYLSKVLLPVRLNMIYPRWQISGSLWISYLPGALWVVGFLLFWWKRKSWGRPLLFALGYFVITLFPLLGFFDQSFHRFSFVADHWQYCAIIGVVALFVAGAEKILHRLKPAGFWAVATSVVVLIVLGTATWTRAGLYGNSETLWRDTLAKNPQAWAAHNNLGLVLLHQGNIGGAIEHFQRALELKPDYEEAQYNLGIALARTNRIVDAISHYEQALRLAPNSAEAHNNLAIALMQEGRISEAISHYQRALEIQPDDAEVHYNLGKALKQAGRIKEAIGQFEQALQLKPDFVDAHYALGVALVHAGRTEEALRHFEEALRLRPDYEEQNKLGIALMQLGRVQDAIRHYEAALQLNPNGVEAHYNLAAALERVGKSSDAIKEYQQALRIDPNFAQAQAGLTRLQGDQSDQGLKK